MEIQTQCPSGDGNVGIRVDILESVVDSLSGLTGQVRTVLIWRLGHYPARNE